MPTYEFRCPSGHDFEKFYRSIGAAPAEVACPVCGKIAERQMSAGGGLVFKGSGFYITDYGKDGKKPQSAPGAAKEGATTSGGAEVSGTSETSGKSDAKSTESKGSSEAKVSTAPKPSSDRVSTKKPKDGE
jgi:putative FmdB family regulatory protein